MEGFYIRLRQRLESKKMTANELTTRLGISSANAGFWKKGAVPRLDLAAGMARELGCSLDWLATGREAETPFPQYEWLSPKRKDAMLSYYNYLVSEQEAESSASSTA